MARIETGTDTGPRILVPRPETGRDRFAERLDTCGWRPLCWPVLRIRPLLNSAAAFRALHADIASRDDLIFVSRHAVQVLLTGSRDLESVIPAGVRVFAVGRSTAAALEEAGVAAIYPHHQPDSEGLLALDELTRMRDRSVLICRGEGGRDRLRRELVARGARVDYADLYRREPDREYAGSIKAVLAAGEIDAVAAHSGEVLDALWGCLDASSRERLRALPVLVPGERVAGLARERGCRHLLVAPSALPEAMVDTLVDWYTQSHPDDA